MVPSLFRSKKITCFCRTLSWFSIPARVHQYSCKWNNQKNVPKFPRFSRKRTAHTFLFYAAVRRRIRILQLQFLLFFVCVNQIGKKKRHWGGGGERECVWRCFHGFWLIWYLNMPFEKIWRNEIIKLWEKWRLIHTIVGKIWKDG